MKILVLGWYDNYNCGDESYKISLPSLFPQHDFIFSSTAKNDNYDAVILGGGNVLKPNFFKQLKKVKTNNIYGLSVGLETPSEDLKLFKHIYVREHASLEQLQKINIPCSFLPDLAFNLEGNPDSGMEWIKKRFKQDNLELYDKVVTVVVNGYLINGGQENLARDALAFNKFAYDMAKVIDETPASFLFIPFGAKLPTDDRISNGIVASKCKWWKKNYCCFDRLGVQETLDIISASDLVISSRLHSSIFSYNNGVPFVDITHHDKNKMFLQMVEKTNWSISFWNFTTAGMIDKIKVGMSLPKYDESMYLKTLLKEESGAISFT